jgi:hypothetical protein
MIDDAGFERLALSWIAEGPTTAPTEPVRAAMAEIAETGQDRTPWPRWWSLNPATSRTGLRVAIVAVAAFVAIALLVSFAVIGGRPAPTVPPAPSPAPTAAPTIAPSRPPATLQPAPTAVPGPPLDLPSTFTSARYGYTIGIGNGWTTEPATITWSGPDNSGPVLDHIAVTGKDTEITGASEALLPGQTFDAWIDTFQPQVIVTEQPCMGGDPSTWPTAQVNGVAWRWQHGCQADVALTEQDGRAYVFTAVYGMQGNDLTPSEFLEVLATVSFDAAAVPPPEAPPALDSTFTSDRNGYSLRYPSGWTTKQATAAAPHDFRPAINDPSWDVLANDSARLYVTSVALRPGETTDDWIHAYCLFSRTGWTPSCSDAPGIWWPTPFGSASGWITTDGDGVGSFPEADSRTYQATAIQDGRAYEIRLEGNVGPEVIRAILATMQLNPAAALDAATAP